MEIEDPDPVLYKEIDTKVETVMDLELFRPLVRTKQQKSTAGIRGPTIHALATFEPSLSRGPSEHESTAYVPDIKELRGAKGPQPLRQEPHIQRTRKAQSSAPCTKRQV